MIRVVRLVRNVEFAQLFDSFFISAITTILVVRFSLKLVGYPQIGNSVLHISHLLPGSVLMLTSILLLLGAINRAVRGVASITAGIGFGLVLDEIGKFITKDNNYFFHATPGLIYLTFVVLYLVVRYIARRQLTENDYIANVFDLLKDASINDLDHHEYEHAKQLLSHVSPNHPLFVSAKSILEIVKPTPNRKPTVVDKIINKIKLSFRALTERKFFPKLIFWVAAIYALASLAAAYYFFSGATAPDSAKVSDLLKGDESDWIGGISALVSALCIGAGMHKYLSGNLRRTYRLFELGLLVNIFIGQVVLFFKSQDIALVWLAITLLLLFNLELLAAEKKLAKAKL